MNHNCGLGISRSSNHRQDHSCRAHLPQLLQRASKMGCGIYPFGFGFSVDISRGRRMKDVKTWVNWRCRSLFLWFRCLKVDLLHAIVLIFPCTPHQKSSKYIILRPSINIIQYLNIHILILILLYISIWLVVWNIFSIFPYIGNNNPNWLSYFSEGLKPPTSHISPYLHITDMWPVHRERSRLGAAAGAVREGENTLHLHRGAVRKTLSCGPIGYMEVSWTMATPSHMFSHWLWTNLDLVVPPF